MLKYCSEPDFSPTIASNSLSLNAGDMHIWKVFIPDYISSLDTLSTLLSPKEKVAGDRFHKDYLKARYVVAHAALRDILSYYMDGDFFIGEFDTIGNGKPILPNSKLQFNLSHSGDYAVVGVSISELGVDVECHQRPVEVLDLATRFFTKEEQEIILKSDGYLSSYKFFRVWTLKEAFVKAVGDGLSMSLGSFSVDDVLAPFVKIKYCPPECGDPLGWSLAVSDLDPNYLIAWASREPIDKIKHLEWQGPRNEP